MTTWKPPWVTFAVTAVGLAGAWGGSAVALPPQLLRTSGYEAPVRGDPGELLFLGGYGLDASDRVVYADASGAKVPAGHPARIPEHSDTGIGTAAIVQSRGAPYWLAVRLPEILQRGHPYRLWVVNAAREWSEPVSINDPRPLWLTPGLAYASVDFAGLSRRLRVVGRNLAPASAGTMELMLRGPATYELRTHGAYNASALQDFVAEADLPARMVPGRYSVSARRDGSPWIELPVRQLQVLADPDTPRLFSLDDPQFGACRPNDGTDAGPCLERAIAAAARAGGGAITVPPGNWSLSSSRLPTPQQRDGYVLPSGVSLRGVDPSSSTIVRIDALKTPRPGALLTLLGHNEITGLRFRDADKFENPAQSRPIIQLGVSYASLPTPDQLLAPVEDVVISGNVFRPVGRAVVDSGRPMARLFITHNEFGAYDNALLMTGDTRNVVQPFRIEDAVVRWNRFTPGSYLDQAARQGTIAAQFGASLRMDFSSNVADGTDVQALQTPADPRGWRAAFFWNMNNNHEMLLVSANSISCPGDKAGDGEALAFDGNGGTWAFNAAEQVIDAGSDRVSVRGALRPEQHGHAVALAEYYRAHWIQVMQGPGLGQTRRITTYAARPDGNVEFRVAPDWDVVPAPGATRIVIGRQYWQVYVVANEIEQGAPPCTKANRTNRSGGLISLWAPAADAVIAANRQHDSDGIAYQQQYDPLTASCPTCGGGAAFSTALEIRGNTISGEYDWLSDCSRSGILGSYAAAPTPESVPPLLGFGTVIADNVITHADNLGGGAIVIAPTWHRGPPPGDWPLVEGPLIFHNTIRDIAGPAPRPDCGYGQRSRIGIRLGTDNVRNAVLQGNSCERVDVPLDDSAKGTARACPRSGGGGTCECRGGRK